MPWLQRNAWWGLLALAAASSVLGIAYLVSGDTYLAQDLTGTTLGQIAAESSAGGRLIDLLVRTGGVYLVVLGVALGAISKRFVRGAIPIAGCCERTFTTANACWILSRSRLASGSCEVPVIKRARSRELRA